MPDAIDVHQHLWPAALVEGLRARTEAPYLDGWMLHTTGEPAYAVDPADHDVDERIARDRAAGVRLACVSLSAPLGLESLPVDEADPLLDAWHRGALALPAHFAVWASVRADQPDRAALAELLAQPRMVGLQLPATSLGTPDDWTRVADLLAVAERADKPVFVHPGPATTPTGAVPPWWPPVVDYVAQLHAAWWGWHAAGLRARLPRLRVLFAAAAGLAPVHQERFLARGGVDEQVDPGLFVDTSGYGVRALDAVVRALGIDAVVLGSDRPYADPLPTLAGDVATRAFRVSNPLRLLGATTGGHR